ncbi:diacylglycerol kinase [Enterococcus sp. DIV0756]|uniref:diacylglycerol kinase n=1 Tax=Enterococcus sp. DIV0756 TaxID=2774636 RepID=UPI003F2975C5
MYWIAVFVFFFIVLTVSQFLLTKLKKAGIRIHRWIWAFASFLIMILPNVLLPNLSEQVNIFLYALCAVFAVNFMIEQRKYVEAMNNRYPTQEKINRT